MSLLVGTYLAKQINLNSAWLLLSRVFSQALMFFLSVVVARALGETGLGQYAFIAAVLFLGNVLATFGLDTLLIREIARLGSADTPLIAAALLLQLGISAAFIFLVMSGAGALPNQTSKTLIALRLASFSLIPLAVATVYSAALRAYQRMELYSISILLNSLVQLIVGLVLLNQGLGLLGLAWAMLLGHLMGAASAASLCWVRLPGFGHHWKITRALLRRTVSMSWRLAALMVLAVIYQRIGIFTLSLLSDDAATGRFSAALRIVEAVKAVPYAFFGALFPVMARDTFPTPLGKARRLRFNAKATGPRILLAYAIACGVLLSWLARYLVLGIYGSSYSPAVGALRILIWSLVPFVISLSLSLKLISQGHDGPILSAILLTMLFTTLLCLLFVSIWGLTGACWAVLLGEIVHAVSLWIWQRATRLKGENVIV